MSLLLYGRKFDAVEFYNHKQERRHNYDHDYDRDNNNNRNHHEDFSKLFIRGEKKEE